MDQQLYTMRWYNGITINIVFAFVVLCITNSVNAQIVYSSGSYSMGQTQDGDWTLVVGKARFGISQYRQYLDDSGRELHVFSDTEVFGIKSAQYTVIHFGLLEYSIRMPAWSVASIIIILAASLCCFVASIRGRRHGKTGSAA